MPTPTSPTSWLMRPVSAAPLVVFRVLFGGMMLASIVRFAARGWITELYVAPKVFFPYYGFEWVRPAGAVGMHVVFGLMALGALGILLGAWYRWSAALFFWRLPTSSCSIKATTSTTITSCRWWPFC